MKKFLLVAGLALGLAFTSQQEAQAWINAKFSIGLNWHWQSGGNSLFWGLFHNGQPPGPDAFHFGPPPGGPLPGPYNGHGDFPYFGNRQQTTPQTPAPAAAAPAQQHANGYSGANLFQPVSYPGNYNNYFTPATGAYSPGYWGYFQTPSYWYGR